ncbi:hypothetical protein D4R42_01720 [bacterium]|nr:MAG: hypothetical protein D4R42_01720 [bacterium]
MSEETKFEQLAKGKAYKLFIGGYEIVCIKLEGFKAWQLAGTVSPIVIEAKAGKIEGDDWLVIVKDPQGIVQPIQNWAKQISTEIANVSGSPIGTVSVLSTPISPYKTIRVNSEEELAMAYEQGWNDPYQYATGKWLLRKSRLDISILEDIKSKKASTKSL